MIVLSAGGPNSTILVDNFNDGDDAGWEHEDSTAGTLWGPAIFDASSGAYHLASSGLVPVTDLNVGTIDAHWLRSVNNPRFPNGTLRRTFRANTFGTAVGFLLRTNDEKQTDYGSYGSTSFGTFYIERFNARPRRTVPEDLAMVDPGCFSFVAGQAYHAEGSVVGHTIRMKAWRVGDPPASPILSVTDKDLGTASGRGDCTFFGRDEPVLSRL